MSKIVDTICLKVLTSVKLLTGNGNILQYYWVDANNKTHRYACPETLRDKIHGIIVQELQENEYLIVYFGSRELAFTHLVQNEFMVTKKIQINDWISTAHFYVKKLYFCFVTGHNIIQEVHIDLHNKQFKFENKSWCEDPSTLYCATILGHDWESLMVLAGTALGNLLIWYPKNFNDKKIRSPVQHRLTGHNGVIFSIAANLERELIVTTSDDRSVRFWQVLNREILEVTSLRQVFGHTARIFKSFIIDEDDTTIIASAGEDSYLCLWALNGTLLCKRKLNFGATIWDIDYCKESKTLFTSSSDSNICKLNIKPYLLNRASILKIIEFEAPMPEEYVAKIKILCSTSNVLIGLTNLNRIVYKIKEDKWKSLKPELKYKSCLLEVNGKYIVTAGYETITWLEYETDHVVIVKSLKLPKSMIRSFHFITNGFVACDESGTCYQITENYDVANTFNIPHCKEKWTTACFGIDNIILAGDRSGNLHYFKHETNSIQFQTTLKLVHGNLGITNISLHDTNNDYVYIKTTGHDGAIKAIELSKTHGTLSLYHTYKTDVVWIERIISNRILGFNDNYFVIWEKYNGIIHEFECGGRHRNWDVEFNQDNSMFTFLFIRNKKIYRNQFSLAKSENRINLINFNWHIESCNAADIVEIDGLTYVVSGGDDNLLKFSRIVNNEFKNYFEVFSHISNIRTVIIKKCLDGYLVLSAGGRAQICATKIFSDRHTENIKEISSCMLKLNDLQRKRIRNTQEIDFDPETRFMCLTLFDSKIYAGCSDGYIREFDLQKSEINFCRSIFYGTCILNIGLLKNHRIILSMGTDGYICFWNILNFTQLLKLKHHDSGINCFDLFSISQSKYKLISGGDDQRITTSTFEILQNDQECSIQVSSSLSSEELHSAQVTGIKFLDECHAYSVGVDQMINKIDSQNLKCVASRFSSVSDPKGIKLYIKKQKCIVYGAGIEIIDLI